MNNDYLTIIDENSIFRQRTPNSKFVEFSLDGIKLNTYDELPKKIKEIIELNKEMELNPKKHFSYEIVEDGIKINAFLTSCQYIKVPEYIDGHPVVEIGKESLFCIGNELRQIQLPDTINRFNVFSFSNSTLQHINIPKNITTLPSYCFFDSNISEIDLNNVENIDSRAFQNCTKLREINLKTIKNLKDRAFINCIKLKEIILPRINKIPACCFENTAITHVSLPDTIVEIGNSAFNGCENLININFPDTLETIGNNAFKYCENLKEFIAPPNLKSIGSGAFAHIPFKTIKLNEKLERVEEDAFLNFSENEVEEITLYANTTYTGSSFPFCKKLNIIKTHTDNNIER